LAALEYSGDWPVVAQTDVMAWTRKDGRDALQASTDLLVSPPIFSLASGATQVVRVGQLRQADASREIAYRPFIREMDQPVPPGQTCIAAKLRVGMPAGELRLYSNVQFRAPDSRPVGMWTGSKAACPYAHRTRQGPFILTVWIPRETTRGPHDLPDQTMTSVLGDTTGAGDKLLR
jgi:hypothetical protein